MIDSLTYGKADIQNEDGLCLQMYTQKTVKYGNTYYISTYRFIVIYCYIKQNRKMEK